MMRDNLEKEMFSMAGDSLKEAPKESSGLFLLVSL